MEWSYVRSPGHGIDVDLGPAWPGFNHALSDSVSTMPPRSPRSSGLPAHSSGLSTYWIDRTLRCLDGAADGQAVASGNATELVVQGDAIVARSQYEHFDDEYMDRESFIGLLQAWKVQVENAGTHK